MRNEELGIRNEGGGFAASIYGAMPEDGIQVIPDPWLPVRILCLSRYNIYKV